MSDIRASPRSNVSWHAAILVGPGNIVAAKVINFSIGGIQLQCPSRLMDGQSYQLMMEVPDHRDASQRTQVVCKATCMYAILSGQEYRAGMKYSDVPPEHQALLKSWSNPVVAKVG